MLVIFVFSGKEPLDIAVGRADADIVTLLRLAALNEEIRENDMTVEWMMILSMMLYKSFHRWSTHIRKDCRRKEIRQSKSIYKENLELLKN